MVLGWSWVGAPWKEPMEGAVLGIGSRVEKGWGRDKILGSRLEGR